MKLREATPNDVPALARLYAATFNAPPWSDGWRDDAAQERLSRMVGQNSSLGVVAEDGGQLIGLALGVLERWTDGEHFHLKEMCTDATRRRTGVGTLLLEYLAVELRARGVCSTYLQTQPTGPAKKFYERHGFRTQDLETLSRREDTFQGQRHECRRPHPGRDEDPPSGA